MRKSTPFRLHFGKRVTKWDKRSVVKAIERTSAKKISLMRISPLNCFALKVIANLFH
ncbi:hypothetical protein COAQ111491_13970 [Comamonas aquatilis]